MSGWKKWLEGLGVLLLLGLGAIVVADSIGSRSSKVQEVSSYQAAVNAQSKAEALRFISAFRSSPLVGNLILSLKPDVARRVCTDLPGGGPRKAREACEVLHKIETDAAAEVAMVNSDSDGADASTSVPSNDELRDIAAAGNTTVRTGGPYAFHPLPAAPTPIELASAVLPLPPRLIAAVPSDDEPRDIAATGNTTVRTGGPYAFHPLPAAPTPIELASAVLPLPPRLIAAVPSDDEPRDIAATGNTTVRTGGPYAFHPLPAAPTPIELASAVLPLPPRLIAAVPSDDEPRDIAAAGNTTVRTGGPYAFHPLPAAPTPIELASAVLPLPPRLIAAVRSDDEPRDIAATGNTTVRTGGPYAFHPLPAAPTPIDLASAVLPLPPRLIAAVRLRR